MFSKDDGRIVRPVFGRSKLPHDGRSKRIVSAHSKKVTGRGYAGDAKHADYLSSTIVKCIEPPKAVHAALEAIEKALIETGQNFDQDVDDWVLATSTGMETAEDVIEAANTEFGGCPFHKIMRHFDIQVDTDRVLAAINGHGFCVVQIFRNVSLSKLLLVWRIASPYTPLRRMIGSPKTQADFEADAKMWHAVGDAYELAWDLRMDQNDQQCSLFDHIENTYKTNADRFAGRTRYSTMQFDDQKDFLKNLTNS